MKDDRIKDHEWWEEYFAVDGGWERNDGRSQSRIFAEHFTDRIQLDPNAVFSMLDAGCALGDALKHFAIIYPRATLHGIDFSATAITRCKNEIGGRATFSVGDIEKIGGHYDIIYCSNTLEHFPDFGTKARQLVQHCDRLCILVPYKQLENGKPLIPRPNKHHQHTFLRDSFDFLVREGLAWSIKTHVFSCPGAWGWTHSQRRVQVIKNVARVLLNRPSAFSPRQILFDVLIARKE